MKKKDLERCLKSIFFDDLCYSRITMLRYLASAFTYYFDDDCDAKLIDECNKLNMLIYKINYFYDLNQQLQINIPTGFRCNIDSHQSAPPNNFTFSPVINIPPLPDTSRYDEQAKKIEELLESEIDVTRLAKYVREKAVAAGDFTFEAE